jgi:hypothetical protein
VVITKEQYRSCQVWRLIKGKKIIAEARCRSSRYEVELQIIRRLNKAYRGLIKALVIDIIQEAHNEGKTCVILIRPLRDTFRPFETFSEANKRLKKWYASMGFLIEGNKGINPFIHNNLRNKSIVKKKNFQLSL